MAAFLFLIKIEINRRKSYYLNSHILTSRRNHGHLLSDINFRGFLHDKNNKKFPKILLIFRELLYIIFLIKVP